MTLDVLATRSHYADHIRPVWDALDRAAQGRFMRTPEPGPRAEFILTASYEDHVRARAMGYTRLAFIEHGIGQSYLGVKHGSWAGGWGREGTELFMVPNDHAAARWRKAYPKARVEVVGCPKLATLPRRVELDGEGWPIIAFAWHWDCPLVPETRSAFHEYKDALAAYAKDFVVLGHGHPRLIDRLEPWYRSVGIEVVRSFAEVCERADVFVADNTSALYEFAATGRPVVVINARQYRRGVNHGLRFWEAASVGVQCDRPADLRDVVAEALVDSPERQQARAEALALVYQPRADAAAVLADWAGARETVAA